MPTTPKVNVVVSDEAKEARKEREPEATFESAAQETPFPVNNLDAAVGNVSTKATEIDPEVIADEAATLKNSVRHEKELNDLLREKEVDDDDTIVDKKIVKEEAIIETFEKVNVKELEKIDQTLASVAAEEAATVKDASLSTSLDVEETKKDSTATTTTMTSSSPSSSSCDETVRGGGRLPRVSNDHQNREEMHRLVQTTVRKQIRRRAREVVAPIATRFHGRTPAELLPKPERIRGWHLVLRGRARRLRFVRTNQTICRRFRHRQPSHRRSRRIKRS